MTLQEKFDSIMNSIESLIGVGEEDIPNAVAREAGLNLRQLADSFQFMTDMTLIKYIRRRRLVHALDTRIALGLPVEEVVSIAGFSDAAAFSKACKNEFDLSPAQIDRDALSKYVPLSFELVSSGKNADQMENGTLITMMKENTICGISVSQFATVKQMLEISALYGFNDEETEFVYRLSEMEEITITQAAEFYEDFRMQIENGSIVPGLDIFELAELACKYSLSYSQAQEILFMLEKNGYHSIRELPECFFDIYFSRENEQYAGWDVPYICEIAEAMADNNVSADELDDILFLAWMNGTDPIDAIENHKEYEKSFDKMAMDALDNGVPEDDTGGFGYRSIWELDEED